MKSKTSLITLALLAFTPIFLNAQIDFGSASSTVNGGAVTAKLKDWMAIGVNPANLGWDENHKFSISILNLGMDAQANSLDFPTLFHLSGSLTNSDKQKLENCLSTPPGLLVNSEFNWISGSFNINKIGGFAIGISDKVMGRATLSRTAANALLYGINFQAYADSAITMKSISNELAGSSIAYSHLRELNIDYGRSLLHNEGYAGRNSFNLYAGVGLKYIWGLSDMETQITGSQIEGHSSMANSDLGKSLGNMTNAPGHGFGVDLGRRATYDKWKFGLSITDLGFVKWKNNYKVSIDTSIAQLIANNPNFATIDYTSVPISDIVQYGPGPDYTTSLPTKLKIGADFRPVTMFEFSSDIVFPLNKALGNIPYPYYVLAGEVHGPLGFDVNLGVAASSYGIGIPLGVFLGPTKIYVGTGDILSILGLNKSPNNSLVVGVFHFDF